MSRRGQTPWKPLTARQLETQAPTPGSSPRGSSGVGGWGLAAWPTSLGRVELACSASALGTASQSPG